MSDASDLEKPYVPQAIYFRDGDRLEYVTVDCAGVYHRIDANFSAIKDMRTNTIAGFELNQASRVLAQARRLALEEAAAIVRMRARAYHQDGDELPALMGVAAQLEAMARALDKPEGG